MTTLHWSSVSDAEKCAAVAEHVMGLKVVGESVAIFVEGEWSIHPDSSVDGWACHASVQPVYAERESEYLSIWEDISAEMEAEHRAQFDADMARWGHSRYDLSVVPDYLHSWDAMRLVVERMRAQGFDAGIETDCDGWYAEFEDASRLCDAHADTLPTAVAIAALRACGITVEVTES